MRSPFPIILQGYCKEEASDGFRLLFNGKDLSGWRFIGPEGAWGVEKGLLACNGKGRGWIRPEGTYADFILRLDYRISPRGDSGIFIRTSEEGRPAYQGMEIKLLEDPRSPIPEKSTGAIYDAVAPTQEAARPAGHWNQIEVSCQGPTVRVVLNGREIVDCDTSAHPALKNRLKSGLMGLHNHNSPIKFRNIRIKVL